MSPRSPDVSVLLPVGLGVAPYLELALDSVAAQRGVAFECLLVLDRPDPATRDLAHRRARSDRRFAAINSPAPGIVAALNHALGVARAQVACRMDADDSMRPERLLRQRARFDRDGDLALLGAGVEMMPGAGAGRVRYAAWHNAMDTTAEILLERFAECPIAHPTFAFPTALVHAAGGYAAGDFPEDYELVLRLAEQGRLLAKLPEVLHDWRDRPDRLSRIDPRYGERAFLALKARYLARALPALAGARPVWLWGGRNAGRLAKALATAGAPAAAILDIDPKAIGGTRAGLPVIDGRADAPFGSPPPFLLAALGGAGGAALRAELARRGLVAGRDWLRVAY